MKLLFGMSVLLSLATSLPSDRHGFTHANHKRSLCAPNTSLDPERFQDENHNTRMPSKVMAPGNYGEGPHFNNDLYPGDFRCDPKFSSSTRSSQSTTHTTVARRIFAAPQPDTRVEVTALTGPRLKFSHLPSAIKTTNHKITKANVPNTPTMPKCPLNPCTMSKGCGPAALCTKGFCACPPGRTSDGVARRGTTWPEAGRVFVQPDAACKLPCTSLFCTEIEKATGCPSLESETPGSKTSIIPSVTGQGAEEKEDRGGIGGRVAGDDKSKRGDYIGDIAPPERVGENV
jgi:hypothetical protein